MTVRVVALALVALAFGAPMAAAQPGDLDPSFGDAGTAALQVAPNPDFPSTQIELIQSIAGRTVVAGTFDDSVHRQPFVARFEGDALDPDFGDGGVVRLTQDGSFPRALTTDGSGRLIVVLEEQRFNPSAGEFGGYSYRTLLVRLDGEGNEDLDFGTAGRAAIDGLDPDHVAVAPNGRIAVAGRNCPPAQFCIPQLQLLGPDEETGDADFPDATITGLGFDGSGRLLASALGDDGQGRFDGRLLRWAPALTGLPVDTSFGDGDGVVVLPEAADGRFLPQQLRVDADGSALLGGAIDAFPPGHRLLRVSASGAPSTGFGDGGFSERVLFRGYGGFNGSEVIAEQPDGKLLVGSGAGVVRWTADGALDKAYGDGGKAAGMLPGSSPAPARGMALDAAGRPVIAGYRYNEGAPDCAADPTVICTEGFLARLLAGDGTLDVTAPALTVEDPPATVQAPRLLLDVATDDPHAYFDCSYDGDDYAECDRGGALTITLPGEAELPARANGPHSFGVRVTDQSGNSQTTVVNWTTDVPPVEILSGPSGRTNAEPLSFTFSPPGEAGSLLCALDGGPQSDCSAGIDYDGVGEGAHTLTVERSGLWFAYPGATRDFTVDRTAPQTSLVSGPESGDRTPTIAFAAVDSDTALTYECRIVGAGNAFTPCSSPWTAPEVGAGRHHLQARAIDSAGNREARGVIAEAVVAGGADPPGGDPPGGDPGTGGTGGGGPGGSTTGVRLKGVLVGGYDTECMKQAVDDGIGTPLGSFQLSPSGGLTGQVTTRGPGKAAFTVTTSAAKAKASGAVATTSAKRKRKVVYAKGRATIGASLYKAVQIRPTKRGRRTARARKGSTRTLRLTMVGTFKPKQRRGKRVRVVKRYRLVIGPATTATASQRQEPELRCAGDGHPPFAVVYLPTGRASTPTARQTGTVSPEPSYCEEEPKKCIPTARFCAQGDNRRMFCEKEVDGIRVPRDPCVEDASICLVQNHNQCARQSSTCSRYKEMGQFNYVLDWCAESPDSCAPEDACFNHPFWEKPRNALDCEPALSHQFGLVGRPKNQALELGQPIPLRRYPWWSWWFTNGPGNPSWPPFFRPVGYDPVSGGSPTQPAGPPPSFWLVPTTYLWPVNPSGGVLGADPIDPGDGRGGGGNGCGIVVDGVQQGFLTVWGECAYAK